MFRPGCARLTALVFVGLLTACASTIENWNPDDYTVKSGDTVYSIAWRYELDPEEFAAWNRLGPSKIIRPGQRLHTRPPKDYVAAGETGNDYAEKTTYVSSTAVDRTVEWVKVEKDDTLSSISRQYSVSIERLVQLNSLKDPSMITPGQRIYLKPRNVTAATSTSTSTAQKAKADKGKTASGAVPDSRPGPVAKKSGWPKTVRWQRPAEGKVVKKYDRRRSDAKGIDIAGKQGDSIIAAADGQVVYSGDGLISYGKLIIIKHNDTYLSAYAYNHKLLVTEGNTVSAGQKIAEMGRKDDRSSPRLHFEIRKNGKPVDPLKYLPW